ncbi:MAG: GatB/YqeY domain-containing protein [Acidobacteriota bacterium]|nr:MAG: GatB/YqeY domain-containing protein [Acidobacteriota bacterium]
MSLRQQILDDLKHAMKARDQARTATLRMLKAKMTEAEVAQRAKRGLDYQLDDAGVTQVLSSYAKQRRESIASYEQGGRDDLVRREQLELEIVESYLPRQLDEEELRARVREIIASLGASSPSDLGTVMRRAMEELRGRADGKAVNQIVRELLAAE